MKCMMCGKSPVADNIGIFRLNDKGKPGVWACAPHYAQAKQQYYPDDDPLRPAPGETVIELPLGPWTGGVTPIEGPK